MSLSCSNAQDHGIATSIVAVQEKKDMIGALNASLVSGKKSIANASVADLATARLAEIKIADFQSGIQNLNKAVDVLQMAESFLNHARCGLQEMKEIATNATAVMSDATREASLAPQFKDALERFESGSQTYKYDCLPLLDGNFFHQFIVSSVCGQPTMETIDLQGLNFSAKGLNLSLTPTDVSEIESKLQNLRSMLEAAKPKVGGADQNNARDGILSEIANIQVQMQELLNQTRNNISSAPHPEGNLVLGSVTDDHLEKATTLYDRFEVFVNIMTNDVDGLLKSPAWKESAPSDNPGNDHSTAMVNNLNAGIADVDSMLANEFAAVNTSFVYDKSIPAVQVNTHDNAVTAEAVIDTALTQATNAITKVQGQQNALNRIGCLLQRNVLLQNKVADEFGSVDPIATNAKISENKLKLERAVCALKEYGNMQKAMSSYLSQCGSYCA